MCMTTWHLAGPQEVQTQDEILSEIPAAHLRLSASSSGSRRTAPIRPPRPQGAWSDYSRECGEHLALPQIGYQRMHGEYMNSPWYALRQAGPAIISTSPERRRIGVGVVSRVWPPIRKIAAHPSLTYSISRTKMIWTWKDTHDMETSGEVAQISERSTWPMRVSCRVTR